MLARLASAFAVALAVLAAPASAAALHRGNQNEPQSLDPNRATGSWEFNILGDLFEGLTTEDARAQPIPGAAESWTTSADGLTWTFKLRSGATWSDGVPVTAEDFVFAWRRILAPETAAEYASILFVVKNAEAVNAGKAKPEALGIRAVDASTLEVTLEHPAPYLLELMMHVTAYPLPRHVVEAAGANWTQAGTMVSNGPFMLAEWRPGEFVRAVKNPAFHAAGEIAIDEVFYYPTDDSEAALRRFRSGDLDLNVGFPSQQYDWLMENLPESVRTATVLNTRFVNFLTEKKPFDDARVRLALSMAIDREAIADILKSGEQPAYGLVPPGTAGYGEGPKLSFAQWPMEKRVADAKLLLKEAGFDEENPLAFTYRFIADNDSRRVAAALQEMWGRIGAKVELSVSEKKAHYVAVRARDYQVAEGNWFADYNDAGNFLFLTRANSGDMNASRWRNKAFEELMAAADVEPDAARRAELMKQAEAVMLEDAGLAPLFFGVSRTLIQPYVSGFEDNLLNVHRTRWMKVDRGEGG